LDLLGFEQYGVSATLQLFQPGLGFLLGMNKPPFVTIPGKPGKNNANGRANGCVTIWTDVG
jgi:hypothetical protein